MLQRNDYKAMAIGFVVCAVTALLAVGLPWLEVELAH
jgi:hypothetical protein